MIEIEELARRFHELYATPEKFADIYTAKAMTDRLNMIVLRGIDLFRSVRDGHEELVQQVWMDFSKTCREKSIPFQCGEERKELFRDLCKCADDVDYVWAGEDGVVAMFAGEAAGHCPIEGQVRPCVFGLFEWDNVEEEVRDWEEELMTGHLVQFLRDGGAFDS